MSDAFKSIEKGLHEAVAHMRGAAGAVVHEIEVPDPDVRGIRNQTGLSQADFARSIGVKKATLLNWEQRRRRPDGAARVLLAMIEREPDIVRRVLG